MATTGCTPANLEGMGRLAEARAAWLEGETWMKKSLSAEGNDSQVRQNMASLYFHLAKLADREGNRSQAHEYWRGARREAEALIAKDPAARKYLGNQDEMEQLGRKWGLLPAAMNRPAGGSGQ